MFESVMTICGCIFIFWITVCISCVGYLWIKYDLLPVWRERRRLKSDDRVIAEIARADQAYSEWILDQGIDRSDSVYREWASKNI